MEVVEDIEKFPLVEVPVHLAIGMFDGIHIGHQAVIESCINAAKQSNGVSAVLTFWPHPSKILRPEAAVPQIMPLASKRWTLESKGVDFTIVQSFQNAFAKLEATEFISYLKTFIPKLNSIFVGENFRFGKGRNGDVSDLREFALALGVHVVSMEQCKVDGESVSSTRIRSLLKQNSFKDVNFLLGHPYTIIGKTVEGRKIGRTIGFPTLNVSWSPELKPPFGVYAVKVAIGKTQPSKVSPHLLGVANYGIRPTYDLEKTPVLEVHLLEPIDMDYGTDITVELIQFLRAEQKFTSPEALTAQIQKDVTDARSVFSPNL